jgi:hypothetical protein
VRTFLRWAIAEGIADEQAIHNVKWPQAPKMADSTFTAQSAIVNASLKAMAQAWSDRVHPGDAAQPPSALQRALLDCQRCDHARLRGADGVDAADQAGNGGGPGSRHGKSRDPGSADVVLGHLESLSLPASALRAGADERLPKFARS